MLFNLTLAVMTTALLTGCSDPKAANEKNFAVAIQTYLNTTYPRCYVYTEFPAVIEYDFNRLEPRLKASAITAPNT